MDFQVVKCKCGNVFAACAVPECYSEKSWMKDLKKYIDGGCSIQIMDSFDLKNSLGNCACPKTLKDVKNIKV